MKPVLKKTADGSSTFYLPEMDEQYHSMNGAVTESRHIFLDMGFEYHPVRNPVVFEVGFGTGLNALVTAIRAGASRRKVFYITMEKYPLDIQLISELNYGHLFPEGGYELFASIHECGWDVRVNVTPFFEIYKMKIDFTSPDWELPQKSDVIYFDAFGPDKQLEMWTSENLLRLYHCMNPGGVLVTYSAKGEVRRRLQKAGFRTERLPGPPGKKEMLRGIK